MTPTPVNLKKLRDELNLTQGQMADLCGYAHVIDKAASLDGQPRPNAAMWRKLTAPESSASFRRLSPEAFFYLAAHIAIPDECKQIHYIIGTNKNEFYKDQNSQIAFYAFAHKYLSDAQLNSVWHELKRICSL